MVRSLSYFKSKFVTGYEITQEDIADWLDSFRHATTPISLSDAEGLTEILSDYRAKTDNVPAGEIEGLASFVNSLLENYITTGTAIEQTQITGLVDALAGKATLTQVQDYVDSLGLEPGADGEDGVSITGVTINSDKHLIVTLSDATEIDAGQLPAASSSTFRTVLNHEFSGARNDVNRTFTLPSGWKSGTLKLYVEGLRQTPGGTYDYEENETDRTITFNVVPSATANFLAEYEEK